MSHGKEYLDDDVLDDLEEVTELYEDDPDDHIVICPNCGKRPCQCDEEYEKGMDRLYYSEEYGE